MNREQCNTLADKLSRSWGQRGGIGPDVWAEALADLTHGPAEAATRQLIATAEHQPTIAAFIGTYRALLGTAPRTDCDRCQGTGLVTVDRSRNLVGACNCRNGTDGRATLDRINSLNDAEPALMNSRSMARAGTGPPPRKEPLL